jgi:hypothetical protein
MAAANAASIVRSSSKLDVLVVAELITDSPDISV